MSKITIRLPPMYPKQEQALMSPKRFVFVEGSTKSGKTAGCMSWQAAQILTGPPKANHWWVGPVYEQAKIAFRRALSDYEGIYSSFTQSPMEITFPNKSKWVFKSAERPDSLYGEECYSIVIDEATRTKEEVFDACRSTLTTTRGPLRAIGNVKGRKNWHYIKCRQAESGHSDEYHYAKLTAQDAVDGGILDPKELHQAELDLPHEVFRQLYFCEPTDQAFNPFGYDKIRQCVGPLSTDTPVVYGLDLARKVDYSVLIGLDARGRVAYQWSHKGADWAVVYDHVQRSVGNTLTLVDATGVGDPISQELQRRGVKVESFIFTPQSKQDLLTGLRIALTDKCITFPEGPILDELESFEYSLSTSGRVAYSAPVGLHDDHVMALGLAYHAGTVLTSRVKPPTLQSVTHEVFTTNRSRATPKRFR